MVGKEWPNLRWKDACKRDMTEVGLKEDTKTNSAAWRNTIISHTGDPRVGQAREEDGWQRDCDVKHHNCHRFTNVDPLLPFLLSCVWRCQLTFLRYCCSRGLSPLMMIPALPLVCYLINLLVFSISVCDAQRNYANTACCVRPNDTTADGMPI